MYTIVPFVTLCYFILRIFVAVCVDGGMYMGTLSYLEIQPSGRYIAHEFVKSSQKWEERDLTELACMDQ